MKPIRIQRKRTKGWRMSPNTIYVGRPTIWGNPFVVGRDGDADRCVELFKAVLRMPFLRLPDGTDVRWNDLIKERLRGKHLACWCALDRPCHADILLQIANDP